MFCTEKQMSMGQCVQFCILTKISVEIRTPFVYNVRIAVPGTCVQAKEGRSPPERRKLYYVYR